MSKYILSIKPAGPSFSSKFSKDGGKTFSALRSSGGSFKEALKNARRELFSSEFRSYRTDFLVRIFLDALALVLLAPTARGLLVALAAIGLMISGYLIAGDSGFFTALGISIFLFLVGCILAFFSKKAVIRQDIETNTKVVVEE